MASSGCLQQWLRRVLHLKQEEKQEEKQKSIWIHASGGERADYYVDDSWFVVNPYDPRLIRGYQVARAPIPPMPPEILENTGFAISGSRIYVVGGDLDEDLDGDGIRGLRKASADVYYYGREGGGGSRSSGWTQVQPMLHPQAKAKCTIVDGKLYVLGGLRFESDKNIPFGEVFDPITEIWEALPQIPYL